MQRLFWIVFALAVVVVACKPDEPPRPEPESFSISWQTECSQKCAANHPYSGALRFYATYPSGPWEGIPVTVQATGSVKIARFSSGPFGESTQGETGSRDEEGLLQFSYECTGVGSGTLAVAHPRFGTSSVTIDCSLPNDIEVSVLGNVISDGGRDRVGAQEGTFTRTYTIGNVGTAPLTLGVATITKQVNCSATVSKQPPTVVAQGTSVTMEVSVTPTAPGEFACAFSLPNDDTDENPYDIEIAGHVSAPLLPDINVVGASGQVANGANDPVGSKTSSVAFTQAYTVQNVGPGVLGLGAITFPPATNCKATATSTPSALLQGSTGSGPLVLSVTPTGAGAFACPVSIASDDPDENPYVFTITGTTPQGPNVTVTGASSVSDGGTDNVGSHAAQATFDVVYTIGNDGNSGLAISGASIPVGSFTNCTASITTQPATTVAVGASTTVKVTVQPTAAGPFSFTLQIASNDPDQSTFGFGVSGTASAIEGDYVGLLKQIYGSDVGSHDAAVFNATIGGKTVTLHLALPSAGQIVMTPVSGFGPSTLPTLTGALQADNSFEVNGTGTLAGTANVQVRGLGVIDPSGLTSVDLEVGRNATLSGGSVFYTVTAGKGAAPKSCVHANGMKLIGGKKIYRVPTNVGCSGDQVCAAAGLTCAGVPVLSPVSSACAAFHPGTQVKADLNGWNQSVYCTNRTVGLACNGEFQCHDCPLCSAANLACNDPNSTLLSELFVECK